MEELKNILISEGFLIAVITAFSALAGAFLPKLFESFFKKVQAEGELEFEIRQELRKETRELRKEIRELSAELDTWKIKYYEVYSELMNQRRGFKELKKVYEEDKIEEKLRREEDDKKLQ